MVYMVYFLYCKVGSKDYYIGHTNNLQRRMQEHVHKKGGKYTQKAEEPIKLLCAYEFETKSQACKEEKRVKRLNQTSKIKFMKKLEEEGRNVAQNFFTKSPI